MLFAVIEGVERGDQQVMPDAALLVLGDDLVLQRAAVDQEILPLSFAALVAFERDV